MATKYILKIKKRAVRESLWMYVLPLLQSSHLYCPFGDTNIPLLLYKYMLFNDTSITPNLIYVLLMSP